MNVVFSKKVSYIYEYKYLDIEKQDSSYSIWGIDKNNLNWFIVGAKTLSGAKKELNRWIKEHKS